MFRNPKIVIRLILFILAFALAVFSFTYGVKQIGHREPGWQTIEVDAQKGHVTYTGGLTFMYWAEGSDAAIRELSDNVKKVYSDALYRNVELLDARNTYEDSVNLASLNEREGQVVTVSERLGKVLKEALNQTRENAGYSVFAGALWNEWQTLLYLDEPQPFDPAVNEEQAAKIRKLVELINAPDTFSLEITEKGSETEVCFRTTPEYRQVMEELEITAPALDLGIMRDAVLMDLVAEDLCAAGYTEGVLYSKTGLAVLCGKGRTLTVFPEEDERPETSLTVTGPAVTLRFSASEPGTDNYGAYEAAGMKRHAFFDTRTGDFHNRIEDAVIAGEGISARETVRQMLLLNCAEDPETVSWPYSMRGIWTLQGDTAGTVYAGGEKD